MNISPINTFNSLDSHHVEELEVFVEDGVEKIKYLGCTAELMGHNAVIMGNMHTEVRDHQFHTELKNGITVCWKWYSGYAPSNYQREDLEAVYDWGAGNIPTKLALLEDDLGRFYLINPNAQNKVMRVYKHSDRFYSYVDPEFIKEQALSKKGEVEYAGLVGTYGTVVSANGYEGDFTLGLSDGNKFLVYRPTPLFKFMSDPNKTFPFEGLKMAFIKPPADFANSSFFERPDAYLLLVEKNGRWHPFPVIKHINWYWIDNLYEHWPYDIGFFPPNF